MFGPDDLEDMYQEHLLDKKKKEDATPQLSINPMPAGHKFSTSGYMRYNHDDLAPSHIRIMHKAKQYIKQYMHWLSYSEWGLFSHMAVVAIILIIIVHNATAL